MYHLKSDGDDLDSIRKNSGTNNNTKVEVQKDIKESFEVGREDDPVMPNIWYPEGVLPGFQDACLDFFWVSISTKFDIYIYVCFILVTGMLRYGEANSKGTRSRFQFI